MQDTLHYVAPLKLRISKYLANAICSHSTCEVGVFPNLFISEQSEAQPGEDACSRDPWDGIKNVNPNLSILPFRKPQSQSFQNTPEQHHC